MLEKQISFPNGYPIANFPIYDSSYTESIYIHHFHDRPAMGRNGNGYGTIYILI